MTLRDLGSTNGTRVNGIRVEGDCELEKGDRLQIGPLEFAVRIEDPDASQSVSAPKEQSSTSVDDEVAAILLLPDEIDTRHAKENVVDAGGVPVGDTAQALPPPPEPDNPKQEPSTSTPPPVGDTSSAARALLRKYRRGGKP